MTDNTQNDNLKLEDRYIIFLNELETFYKIPVLQKDEVNSLEDLTGKVHSLTGFTTPQTHSLLGENEEGGDMKYLRRFLINTHHNY